MSATCNCCSGVHVETPRTVANRAGLTAIAYRAGDWASFRRSMHASLTGTTAMSALTTRENDDFTIALLDAFAMTADVLTFYQERIANESYLRTAGERFSLLELARLIGYELTPGVAASVWLAFSVDETPGAPGRVRIDAGSKVQSVPGQDEEPQTFETSSTFEARVEWNAIRAAQFEMRKPKAGESVAYFDGTDTKIAFGDGLLFGTSEFHRVLEVTPDFERRVTRVKWDQALKADANQVRVLRVKANLFGHNAPPMLTKVDPPPKYGEWPFSMAEPFDLDGLHPSIAPGSTVIVTSPGAANVLAEVESVSELSRTDYGLSGKVTRVGLKDTPVFPGFTYRLTVVYGDPRELPLAGYPLPVDLAPNDIPLETAIPAFEKNRPLLITGVAGGKPASEIAYADQLLNDGKTLRLMQSLKTVFRRGSVRIHANVAEATHGETVREVLGSGDAAVPFQRFRLSHAPLTYTPAPWEPDGAASTLQIFVNDMRWTEVSSLYGKGPNARVYTVRRNDDGHSWVQFGDGKTTGSRLPSGVQNVRAIYRKTMGMQGNVAAGKLTMLMSRPLGLGGVTNPIAASGGDDAQKLADVRANAPKTVLTLDRVVSLRDYESFATSWPGIAKAIATWTWAGTERQVFLTVAGRNGASFPPNDPALRALQAALRLHGHPYVPIRVLSYEPVLFDLFVKLGIDADRVAELVFPQVRAAVEREFGFAMRHFGEAVDLSDVVKVIHSVAGVASVDVEVLRRHNQQFPLRNERLTARLPREENGTLIPAEILILGPFAMEEVK